MQNINFLKKYLRGSSSLQETEKLPDGPVMLPALNRRNRSEELPMDISESVSDNWVSELRPIGENQKDFLRGIRSEELRTPENDTRNQSDDERRLPYRPTLSWRDDGGDRGEDV
jgi:hypothetical protein